VFYLNMKAYDIDFKEEAVIKSHIKSFLLYPQFWNDIQNQLPINLRWHYTKFDYKNIINIPSQSGVYAFILKPTFKNFIETRYLFYIGKTNRTLRDRFQEYINEQEGKGKTRKKVHKMLNQFNGYLFFYWAEIPIAKNVNECEEKLLNTFVPHVNTSIPKAKIKNELKYIYEPN